MLETFQDFLTFQGTVPSSSELERFDETLMEVRKRHANIVPDMAEAVMSMKFEMEEQNIEVNIEYEENCSHFFH